VAGAGAGSEAGWGPGEGRLESLKGGDVGLYRRLCTCETLCERSSGMSFICVVIGLECRFIGWQRRLVGWRRLGCRLAGQGRSPACQAWCAVCSS